MPIFNVTIPDTSPLIRYNGLWHDSDHADGDWAKYANETFHATDQYNASAALTFSGSAIYVYGARRVNHGQYWVTLDGVRSIENGLAGDIWNSSLFSATDLDSGEHSLLLQNAYIGTTAQWVDIDYIVLTTGDGNALTPSNDIVWDDDHKNITYSTGWDTSPNGVEDEYYMRTMHRTNILHASATISFSGDAISVIGHASTNHGLFSVSLDNGEPLILNGSASAPRPQSLLYYASGLSTSPHTLTVTNVDTDGAWLDLDKVVVSQWSSAYSANPTMTVPTPSSIPTTSRSSGSKSNTGIIVGAIIAGVAGLGLLIFGIFMLVRRSKRKRFLKNPSAAFKEEIDPEPRHIPGMTPEPFYQWNTVTGSQVEHNPSTPNLVQSASTSNLIPPSVSSSDSKSRSFFTMTAVDSDDCMPPPDYQKATALLKGDGRAGSIL